LTHRHRRCARGVKVIDHARDLDCTLFHSLPLEARDEYLRVIHRAAAPNGSLQMLVFTTDALPADSPFPVPNLITKDELQQAVSATSSCPTCRTCRSTASRSTGVVG
jgi:hypothetical protein